MLSTHTHTGEDVEDEDDHDHGDVDEAMMQLGILDMWVERVQGVVDELRGGSNANS